MTRDAPFREHDRLADCRIVCAAQCVRSTANRQPPNLSPVLVSRHLSFFLVSHPAIHTSLDSPEYRQHVFRVSLRSAARWLRRSGVESSVRNQWKGYAPDERRRRQRRTQDNETGARRCQGIDSPRRGYHAGGPDRGGRGDAETVRREEVYGDLHGRRGDYSITCAFSAAKGSPSAYECMGCTDGV